MESLFNRMVVWCPRTYIAFEEALHDVKTGYEVRTG